MLSLRLLRDCVAMGLRWDERITAEGLMLSVEDAQEKLDAFIAVVDGARLAPIR